ncbi:unnamed protein product [Hanseniaspora opuntiae]
MSNSNNKNNKKILKMKELQDLQKQFEGIETENSKLTSVIGKIKQEINWYSTYINKCKTENPTTFNRLVNGVSDGSEGINMLDLELNSNKTTKNKINKKQAKAITNSKKNAEKSDFNTNMGLANGFDDIGIDLGFLETTADKQQDIIVDDIYFDPGTFNNNSLLKNDLSTSNSNLNLNQLGFNNIMSSQYPQGSILQQVQQYQDQQKINSFPNPNDELMMMNSIKDALNNI